MQPRRTGDRRPSPLEPARRSLPAEVYAAALVFAFELPAVFAAWGPPLERASAALACLAALTAGALMLGAWACVVPPELAATPFVVGAAWALGRTPMVARRVGTAGPFLVGLALLAAVLLMIRFLQWAGAPGATPRRHVVACALVIASAGALLADALLPARLYPEARLVLILAAFAVAARALAPVRGARGGDWRARTVGAAVCALGAAVLLRTPNVRFIASERAPATGLLLGGIDRAAAALVAPGPRSAALPMLAPTPSPRSPTALGGAHLVLVTIDALRADALGPATPTLARLGTSGRRFFRAYAQAPQTAYSVTSLLTSQPPDRVVETQPPTLTEALRDRRWLTQAFYPAGLFFDGRDALSRYAHTRFGFEWADTRTLPADALTDAVIARLDALAHEGEPRIFLWVHYFDPHEPYDAREGVSPSAPSRARYAGEVAFVDRALGRLVDRLRALRRPTLLVVTADHGEEFGEHGGAYHGSSVYEEQVRVPLLFAAINAELPPASDDPREVGEARRDAVEAHGERAVELLDVAPTAAAALQVSFPAAGVDLFGDNEDERPARAQVDSQRMLVRGRYKVIHDLRRDYDQLYDLAADPSERRNLAGDRPELLAPLHLELERCFGLAGAETLLARLDDPDRDVRAAAARALGAAEVGAARSRLAAALDDADAAVRTEAALALGAIGDERARPELARLLEDGAHRTRAALMLGRLRDRHAVPVLREIASRSATLPERRHAIHYLGLLGETAELALLEGAVADVRVRADVYEALGRMANRLESDEIADWLAGRLLDEPREDARARLTWALAQHRTPAGVSALLAAVRRDPPLPLASEALARLGAVGREMGGVDFGRSSAPVGRDGGLPPGSIGLHDCRARGGDDDPRAFAGVTTCILSDRAELPLRMPSAGAGACILRARAIGERGSGRGTLEVRSGPTPILRVALDGDAIETAVPCRWPRGLWPLRLTFEADVPTAGTAAELDHLLVVPAAPPLRAAVTRRPL
jgi:arylsulfatase A-like enzyme